MHDKLRVDILPRFLNGAGKTKDDNSFFQLRTGRL
jgi:hypothetical protein